MRLKKMCENMAFFSTEDETDMKLCLGTAQFGLDYGINNTRGKMPAGEVFSVLQFAHDNGVCMVDTAAAYGNSETVLGEAFAKSDKNFQVITKYPANTEVRPVQWIDVSLERLKIKKLYGCLFHNYSIFQTRPDYIDDFVKIKEAGKSEKIGFSLYYPSEAEYILRNDVPCDIIQIPYNIFDQRFAGLFADLKNKKIDVHARSIFLQGLFFVDTDKLGARFDSVKKMLRELRQTAKDNSVTTAALCLAFANYERDIAKIVIGVDSLENLKDNIRDYKTLDNLKIPPDFFEKFAVGDENIILPFNWGKQV